MPIIFAVVTLIVLYFVYKGLIKQETPTPIGKSQAVVPVVLGAISPFVSTGLFMGFALILNVTGTGGVTAKGLPLIIRSFIAALLMAGIPEEVTKMVMMLITFRIFKDKIKNGYEYILVGAAVGMGFAITEEFLYGSGSLFTIILRVFTLAAHMIFGIIMARHLALARHNKKHGTGSVGGEKAKALFIPMLIHTLYDTLTANNKLMTEEASETMQAVGMGLAIIALIALFIIQLKVISSTKKKAAEYCALDI